MNGESELIINIWDKIKDYIPASKRGDMALSILKNFEEFGFDRNEMRFVGEEDKYLAKAYEDLYGGGFEDDDLFGDYDD